jgi:crossover junction endodeoxyribonuclease RuvC
MAKSTTKTFGPGISPTAKRVAVGIDQSYSGFGITFLDMDSDGYVTVVFKGEGYGVARLLNIVDQLTRNVDTYVNRDAKEIVAAMEGYAFGSQMANMLGELGGAVKMSLFDLFYQYEGQYPYIIPPTVLKKYVTGKGSGIQKNQMLLHVFKKWGIEFNNDNAADSYALAHMVAGKGDLAYEREIYHNIQDPKYREK